MSITPSTSTKPSRGANVLSPNRPVGSAVLTVGTQISPISFPTAPKASESPGSDISNTTTTTIYTPGPSSPSTTSHSPKPASQSSPPSLKDVYHKAESSPPSKPKQQEQPELRRQLLFEVRLGEYRLSCLSNPVPVDEYCCSSSGGKGRPRGRFRLLMLLGILSLALLWIGGLFEDWAMS